MRFLLALVLCLALLGCSQAPEPADPHVQQWEYDVWTTGYVAVKESVNDRAAGGWELVAVVRYIDHDVPTYTIFYKRRLPSMVPVE